MTFIAQTLASGVVLGWSWYLLARSVLHNSSPAVNRCSFSHVLWCCVFPGMLLLGLLSASPGETFLSPPGFDVHKQVRYDTPHGCSLVQSRRVIPLSFVSFPLAKQVVSKLPCKTWFYISIIAFSMETELRLQHA